MKLLTKTLIKSIPKPHSQEGNSDPVCHVKLFTPWGMWTWYVIEYNENIRMCLGLVKGFEEELGYFSLDELEEIRGPFGMKVERDLYFTPRKLSEIRGK
jgi:hypothetical protein